MEQNKHGLTAAKAGNRAKRDPLSSLACPKARVPHSLQPHRKGWERLSLPIALALLFLTPALTQAQWDIQDSHTTASLRGIANVGGGVAWASGTDGTVLRTEDGGYLWQGCAIPPGAEKLDFRGIQAFDENTAIVMSSGKGDLSRLYKTTDGCKSWKLLFTNPDKDGFWDAIQFDSRRQYKRTPNFPTFGVLIGDPVGGDIVIYLTYDSGDHWNRWSRTKDLRPAIANAGESLFAASNSAVATPGINDMFVFVTGGSSGSRLFVEQRHSPFDVSAWEAFSTIKLPMPANTTSGAFSIAARRTKGQESPDLMIVGGDYQKPGSPGTSAFVPYLVPAVALFSRRAIGPTTPPHGYRSAVAYDATTKTWITVGPNGTDISHDDGKNWSPLKPTASEPPDADKNWNALSLPFVVGHGRIGKLRGDALKP